MKTLSLDAQITPLRKNDYDDTTFSFDKRAKAVSYNRTM